MTEFVSWCMPGHEGPKVGVRFADPACCDVLVMGWPRTGPYQCGHCGTEWRYSLDDGWRPVAD